MMSTVQRSEPRIALACLVHPWSLLALGVLALNDHWFKGVGPVWLTGKLSDFAGLFYFPFLVIACVGIASRPRREALLQLGRLVFWGVGTWFVAAKSIPFVHATTVGVAEALVGEVHVVRDPSDALAVAALVPAWLLYRHLASRTFRPFARAFQPAVVGVAVLLTAATAKPRTPSVNHLIQYDGQLFAVVGDEPDGDVPNGRTFSTVDGTKWLETALPKEVLESHKQVSELETAGEVLRLSGRSVLAARDGAWTTTWSIAETRQEFMKVAGADGWAAVDIAPVPTSPDTIVVALSTEGVVVRSGDGSWTRHGIGGAQPTPGSASFGESLTLLRGQWVFGAAAGFIAWVLVSFLAWRAAPRDAVPVATSNTSGQLSTKIRTLAVAPFRVVARIRLDAKDVGAALAGLALPCAMFALYLLPVSVVDSNAFLPPALISLIAIPLFALSAWPVVTGWKRFHKAVPNSDEHKRVAAALVVVLLALGILFLWNVGWIESLAVAFALAACAIIGSVCVRATQIGSRLP